MEVNEDQTEITFSLEEGVKWHDGEEFTADDVVYTYKQLQTLIMFLQVEFVQTMLNHY